MHGHFGKLNMLNNWMSYIVTAYDAWYVAAIRAVKFVWLHDPSHNKCWVELWADIDLAFQFRI